MHFLIYKNFGLRVWSRKAGVCQGGQTRRRSRRKIRYASVSGCGCGAERQAFAKEGKRGDTADTKTRFASVSGCGCGAERQAFAKEGKRGDTADTKTRFASVSGCGCGAGKQAFARGGKRADTADKKQGSTAFRAVDVEQKSRRLPRRANAETSADTKTRLDGVSGCVYYTFPLVHCP